MNSLPVVIAFFVGIFVYIIGVLLVPKSLTDESSTFTRKQLKDLEQYGAEESDGSELEADLRSDRLQSTGPLARIYYAMPLARFSHQYLVRAGMAAKVDKFFVTCVAVFFIFMIAIPVMKISHNGIVVLIIAILGTYLTAAQIINYNIKSRISKFIDQFPDALDIIVRSVKSGFPLNAAVNMVAESMPAPTNEEFKKMSTEVVHGSTLVDALSRLGKRMKTHEIRFFVVVLTLQQEVGGSLAEVLSNLSSLIRKRKMMVKKIHAITSEGRFTGWVLGALPFLVALAIHLMEPEYLMPLFITSAGHVVLAISLTTIAFGVWIIRNMVNMEI